MPLIQKIEEHNCKIAIWDMSESIEKLLVDSNTLDTTKFKSEKRKKEFLCCKLLLNELSPNTSICYNQFGAPQIEDDNFISISHSKNLAAIIISKKKVGLDIEKISKKPLRLSLKFISKGSHSPISEEKATLIWCCKEAIFKWHQKGNLDFIADIKIDPFIIQEEGQLIAKFKTQKLTLNYKKMGTHFLVYVCK